VNARLDQTGSRVLCSRIDCGTELAKVVLVGGERRVAFGPGWRATVGEGMRPLWVRGRARREPRRTARLARRTGRGQVVTIARILPAWVRCTCDLVQVLEADSLRVSELAEEPGLWFPARDVTDPWLIRLDLQRSGDDGATALVSK
jgi:hypothetical protein